MQEALDALNIEVGGLFNEDDLADAAESLEPNSSAALLVWENVWARKVAQAMRDAGGELIAFERPHTMSFRQPASGCSSGPRSREEARMFGRRGPGLVRAAATTAVVAGTAGAVRHRQQQKYAAQDQAAYDQQVAEEQAYVHASTCRSRRADYAAELAQLAQLKDKGIITEEEFEAKKKQILGI